ncbi:MAG TPA: 5'/3'-nucleotidase SurE, partial [Clostridiales bacterium]|nr:5'/3'-nucleotidase SurE [Clostridiales bacterium]
MKRLIFLTNDDGIDAPGLESLRRQLLAETDWRVLVVAPDRERSGAGHSVSLRQPVYVSERE